MYGWPIPGMHDLPSVEEWGCRLVSRRTQLDVLDFAITAFQEAIDDLNEAVDKLDRFAEIFEQLLNRDTERERSL